MVKRRLAGGVILCFALAAPLGAETPTAIIIGTPPQPTWTQLNTQQKNILAPLAVDWDKMENIRRKKWLGITERYPNMTPNEQARVQLRMREWANLTPEQRAKARDTYKDFNQLPAEQKKIVKQKWEAYSNLPSEEKQRIRENSKSSKLLSPPAQETSNTSPSSEPAPLATATDASGEAGKR
ncbi:DUF3106 domain-containing protein [Quatrionicoccus australiensis]|uniref:DUF3106 domain-containing protein n=1 Tax=Quatrionicoccus australiensis TaxID=138118 RepID=UPI001CFAEC67|nr:DUF3106 domain-containing protein [Quatrionicoccus australiensis]MCB4361220.1 DUF3106 domain-containing protein [Quatrionicoccus australiensis]